MGFVLCSAASAAQYADVAVNSIDCAVSSDGATAEFSINIENKGTITAQNVILRDKMAGVDVSQSQYSIDNGEWQNWNKNYINLGTMTAGQTMLIEFKAPITSNTLVNKAELSTTTREFNRYNNRLSYTTQATYTITSTAGTGGTINPDGNVNVVKGYDQTFTITPDTGYYISDVTVDGSSVGAVPSYTFNNVQSNHNIAATFSRITYTITPSAGTGGTISPSSPQTVNHGDDITFNITPDTGWEIADVLVDGSSVGAVNTYTFNTVTTDHNINVSFVKTYQIYNQWVSWYDGMYWDVSPLAAFVIEGGSQTFMITAGAGIRVDIYVDCCGGPVYDSWIGPDTRPLTFTNVQSNHFFGMAFTYA